MSTDIFSITRNDRPSEWRPPTMSCNTGVLHRTKPEARGVASMLAKRIGVFSATNSALRGSTRRMLIRLAAAPESINACPKREKFRNLTWQGIRSLGRT
ncbi:hypothetical protein GDO78_005400 [Eleutherodactylus coqui]|uniref:Uncharacterized protein n=1 Tax=Eleutherodactylus coqui TaxID=57060 RepID=A0A8J6KF73_ELECQ|nr:hypothetical protein GDO78_005400 [Eleutherodactylus coqui]